MDNKQIWETKYKDTGDPFHTKNKYDQELIDIKVKLIQPLGKKHKLMIDIGCGTGDFLLHEKENFEQAIGVDFSKTMIDQFSKKIKEQKIKNICLYKGEAKNVPVAKEKADFIFSYATLYYIPKVKEVIEDINRALEPGGFAILEFGNSWSLEYLLGLINHKLFGWSKHYCINPFKMKKLIKENNFAIIGCRKFQFIPVASLPTFLSKFFKFILGRKISRIMIDEWISNIPLLNYLAYRNIYILQKYYKIR